MTRALRDAGSSKTILCCATVMKAEAVSMTTVQVIAHPPTQDAMVID